MLAIVWDPHYKGLGLVIQFVGKERPLQTTCEYDCQTLFPFLIVAYNFLNPNDVGAQVPSFASQSTKTTSLYDLIEINEGMTTLVVKKQLNHFKVMKEEAKNPEGAWNTIFKFWVCSSTNSKDCWFLNWRGGSFEYCRYLHKPLTLLVGHRVSWDV